MKIKSETKPHPLEVIAWAAFAERGHHDASSILEYFAGPIGRKRRSYYIVAKDVLESMEKRGVLTRDAHGWYQPIAARARNGDM